MTDDLELLALHGLAVKKAGGPDAVADILGADEAEVSERARRRGRRGPRDRRERHVHGHPAGPRVARRALPRGVRRLPRRPRGDRRLRALRAHQPRAARAVHRLADDARRPAASGSPTTTPTPTTTHGVIDRLGASTSAPRRCSTASRRSMPRLGEYQRARLDAAYDKVLAGETRLRQRRAHRQLPHGLVRAARGPPADARPRTRGGTVTVPRTWSRPCECGERPGREWLRRERVTDRVVVLDGATVPIASVVGNKGAASPGCSASGCRCRRRCACRSRSAAASTPPAGELDDGGLGSGPRRHRGPRAKSSAAGFGDPEAPLLVSVRSGAAVSMPGMMDTVLNLGITDEVEAALARARPAIADFARSTHCRFIHQFGETVLGADLDEPGADATARRRSATRSDATPARRSRPTRTSSCAPRSTRSSAPGPRAAPWPTASTGASPRTAAPR